MDKTTKKDNEFQVNFQVIIDGKLHETTSTKVVTAEPNPKGSYNRIKEDFISAYKKLYPHSVIAIVILP